MPRGLIIAPIIILTPLVLCILSGCAGQQAAVRQPFAWPAGQIQPPSVGGHDQGASVTLAAVPDAAWASVQAAQPGYAQDRAAILALCGDYRVAFDFQESVAFVPPFRLAAPYQSWATERIFVLADDGQHIALQHQLVMSAIGPDGKPGPLAVAKHWRQDWWWQGGDVLRYDGPSAEGSERFRHEAVPADRRTGAWVWTVANIDDGPRYGVLGRWSHEAQCSRFIGDDTWRPLPRREKARKDYQVLVGAEQLIVAPDGWVMFQDNGKLNLGDASTPAHLVAREIGFERYQRISGFDWRPGLSTWIAEEKFWAAIRASWAKALAPPRVIVQTEGADGSLLMTLAEDAADYAGGDRKALTSAQAAIAAAVRSGP